MAEVLVLAEHTADGEIKKVTLELLTAARRLGTPAVVWTGLGAEAAAARLGEYGAEKVYAADSADFTSYVVAPTAARSPSSASGRTGPPTPSARRCRWAPTRPCT